MSNRHEEWQCGCEFLNDERTKACDDHRNFKPSVTGYTPTGTDIHKDTAEEWSVLAARYARERDTWIDKHAAACDELHKLQADKERFIGLRNHQMQSAYKREEEARADLAQRDRRIAELEAALTVIRDRRCMSGYDDGGCDCCIGDGRTAGAALSAPASPATATKHECGGRLEHALGECGYLDSHSTVKCRGCELNIRHRCPNGHAVIPKEPK